MRQPPEKQGYQRHGNEDGDLEGNARHQQGNDGDGRGDGHDDDVHQVAAIVQPINHAACSDCTAWSTGHDGEPPESGVVLTGR